MTIRRTAGRLLRLIARSLLNFCVWVLDLMIPKRQDLWVLANGPGKYWGGNLRAIYEIIKDDPQIRRVIANCGATDCSSIEKLHGTQAQVIPTKTLAALWALLRSHVIVVTHGSGDMVWNTRSSRHFVLNVWHGIPLKGTNLFDAGADKHTVRRLNREKRIYDAVISSSEVDRLAMMSSLNLLPSQVWVTGLPRNDWLLRDSVDLPADLYQMELSAKDRIGDRRLVLYAPTFRRNRPGVYDFGRDEVEDLAAFLRDKKTVLGVRAHINETIHPAFAEYSEIVDLSFDHCPETQVLLRMADVLVTDYSGIWVDFLLLNRPIVGFVYDWDEYEDERGFIYNFEKVFPGPLVRHLSELKSALADALDDRLSEEYRLQHQTALDLFHAYKDDRSSSRILELLKRHATDL